MLIATRLSAMLAGAPVVSSRMNPIRLKAGLVILVSYIALPVVAAEGGTVPDGIIGFAIIAGKEALIGFALGLVAQFMFAAVQTAGWFIDMSAGFAIAQTL